MCSRTLAQGCLTCAPAPACTRTSARMRASLRSPTQHALVGCEPRCGLSNCAYSVATPSPQGRRSRTVLAGSASCVRLRRTRTTSCRSRSLLPALALTPAHTVASLGPPRPPQARQAATSRAHLWLRVLGAGQEKQDGAVAVDARRCRRIFLAPLHFNFSVSRTERAPRVGETGICIAMTGEIGPLELLERKTGLDEFIHDPVGEAVQSDCHTGSTT